MKLVVPYLHEVDAADVRLMQLAQFCGVTCETMSLVTEAGLLPPHLGSAIFDGNSCFVVNASVIKKWSSAQTFPPDLASHLFSRFPSLVVHNLDDGPFAISTLQALSDNRLTSLEPVTPSSATYQITSGHSSTCGAFSGLSFGPVDPANDRVFAGEFGSSALRMLIAIEGRPFLASLTRGRTQIAFLAARTIADLGAKESAFRSLQYFSRLVSPIMLLRHVFRDECWRPNGRHATLVIDDPLLQERYGFLNYARLLELMDRHNFHTSIAFIPRNRLRTSSSIAQLFRHRPDRYSLCVHGNDHTPGEFGTPDAAKLNTLVQTAVQRMDIHRRRTSIPYDKVMVFPQGVFAETALPVLKANNFSAAVNSLAHPRGESPVLTVADYIQPAITGYGSFPLYLRKYVREMTPYDAAFNLFFGQPVLLVEHHAIFKDADRVTQLVSTINSLLPYIQWSSLQTAIENSFVQRETPDGTLEALTYAGCARLKRTSSNVFRCAVVKQDAGDVPLRHALLNDTPLDFSTTNGRISFSFDLADPTSHICRLEYRNDFALSSSRQGLAALLRVVLRRRASEMRDNYLSKSPRLLSFAERARKWFLRPSNSIPVASRTHSPADNSRLDPSH